MTASLKKLKQVDRDGALTALVILFCTVGVFVGSMAFARWTMNQTLGYCLVALYIVYVLFTIAAEAGV